MAVVVIIIVLSGCLTTSTGQPNTQPSNMVRAINAEVASRCTFLGPVDASAGSGWTTAGDRRKALNNLREAVAQRGGNAYVQTDIATNAIHSVVQADAYQCPPTQQIRVNP